MPLGFEGKPTGDACAAGWRGPLFVGVVRKVLARPVEGRASAFEVPGVALVSAWVDVGGLALGREATQRRRPHR